MLDQFAKDALWVSGAVGELIDLGLINGLTRPRLSLAQVADFDQLHSSGYRPKSQQIRVVVGSLYPGVERAALEHVEDFLYTAFVMTK